MESRLKSGTWTLDVSVVDSANEIIRRVALLVKKVVEIGTNVAYQASRDGDVTERSILQEVFSANTLLKAGAA